MSRPVTRTWGLRVAALVVAASLLAASGCWRVAKTPEPGSAPPSPSGPAPGVRPGAEPATAPSEPAAPSPAPAAPGPGGGAPAAVVPPAPAPIDRHGESESAPGAPTAGEAPAAAAPPPGAAPAGATPAPPSPPAGAPTTGPAPAAAPPPEPAKPAEGAEKAPPHGGVLPEGPPKRPGVVVARLPDHLAFDQSGPCWARGREELVYRVQFLGITMGYARFTFNGKVLLGGREVYHLSVRAWTSNVLALIYPMNDTIDYYMDVKTLEPLRQEYTSGNRKKDDVAIYEQETGRIVYRYKESGEIRKQVNAVPNIYDPVTLAYLLRSRDAADDGKPRNVYAGRKVWEISAQPLGVEKISTDTGDVETIVIRPVIKRDGKPENKGDLKMWLTRDERKVPVRLYAKFKKIRTWTLVGELMPERKGG